MNATGILCVSDHTPPHQQLWPALELCLKVARAWQQWLVDKACNRPLFKPQLHQLPASIFESTDPGQHHPPCIFWEPLVKKQGKGIKSVPDTQWVPRIKFTQAASDT